MRSAILSKSSNPETGKGRFSQLPGLCCQAAGGDPGWAEELAQAWALFYIGAGILDKIEDRDQPDSWWDETGEGMAANAASGLYFTASLLLNSLYGRKEICEPASEIVRDFYQTLLSMSSGQHRDLTTPEPTLEEYWEIAAAKSGAFFSLACRCGAGLATGEPVRIQGYSKFGLHLGILLQILDDLEELKDIRTKYDRGNIVGLRRSLPMVYLLEVAPPEKQLEIGAKLGSNSIDQADLEEVEAEIGRSGAGIFVLTEIERQRSQALSALESANPDPEAAAELVGLLPNIEGI